MIVKPIFHIITESCKTSIPGISCYFYNDIFTFLKPSTIFNFYEKHFTESMLHLFTIFQIEKFNN